MTTGLIATSYLEIGQIGSLDIRVPVVTIGTGEPRLAVLCGVHGDETASLAISRIFVREMLGRSLKGSVSIITAANPFAQSTGTRVGLMDFYDLNRSGLGKPKGTFTERLAYQLCEYLSQVSFVVDLHEFKMNTPIMAIYLPHEDRAIDRRSLKGIRAFSPAIVWALNFSVPNEIQYSGTLLAALAKKGVPGFAVETSQLVVLSPQEIQKAAEGLIEVAKCVGVIDAMPANASPPAFHRTPIYSDSAGIWIPTAPLMSEVQKGDKIGELVALDLLKQTNVVAPLDGRLIQLRSNALVHTGTSLFSIGVEEASITDRIRSA